jgi:hypothetical protein
MSDRFLAVLFWSCASAIVLSQVMILASTFRAWKVDGARAARASFAEWSFALVPALAIAGVLWLSGAARV